jgi:Family of unknown function (DUF5681)
MKERVVINENGERKAVPKIVAIFKQLINKAVTGDPRAQKLVLELLIRDESQQQQSGTQEIPLDQFDQQIMDGLQRRFTNMALDSEIQEGESEPEAVDGEEEEGNEQDQEVDRG